MGQWTVRSSSPGANRCWRRSCGRATSSSWTNLAAHKVAGVRQAIEGRAARLLYLPPDLNPIENGLAKLKAHVRKLAARTLDTLEAAASPLQTFRPTECANFFAHAGYGLD